MRHYLWIFVITLVIIMAVFLKISEAEKMPEKDKTIKLPAPKLESAVSIEEAINKRRSVRNFSDKGVNIEQISQLLWAAQGITDKMMGFRAAPSAGALYPIEIYIAEKGGLFHYLPDGHILETISTKDLRGELSSAALFQASIRSAAVDIIICAVYERVTSKYGQRGIRYTDIEAGHVAQNIHLQAVALGLSSAPIGAFDDNAVSKILSLADDKVPLYIIPVGYKK